MSVIDFYKEAEKIEPSIWQCDCSNHSFIIYDNGDLECAECNRDHSDVIEHKQTIRKWTRRDN